MKNVRKQVDIISWEIMSRKVELQISEEVHHKTAIQIRDPIWNALTTWDLLHNSYLKSVYLRRDTISSFGQGDEAWRRVYFTRSAI